MKISIKAGFALIAFGFAIFSISPGKHVTERIESVGHSLHQYLDDNSV